MHLLFLNADFAAAFHRFPWLRARVGWCHPEPLDMDEAGRSAPLSTRSEAPCLLFAGYHSERKGTTWALEALSAWNKPLRIRVAGPLEDPKLVDKLVGKLPGCVTTLIDSQRLSGAALAEHFRASDFVVLPYRKFGGSSSIFVHAMHHGKPVLATDYGMLGRQVRSLECGRLFQPDDRADFLRQLDQLITNKPTWMIIDRSRIFLSSARPLRSTVRIRSLSLRIGTQRQFPAKLPIAVWPKTNENNCRRISPWAKAIGMRFWPAFYHRHPWHVTLARSGLAIP